MKRFLGVWGLDPTTCPTDEEPPPQQGVYTLLADDERLVAHMRWQEADGPFQQTSYATGVDGEPKPLEKQPQLSTRTWVEGDVMTSEITHLDMVVFTDRRTLLANGRMHVLQSTLTVDGPVESEGTYDRVEVKQVICYRRDLKMRKGKIAAQVAHASMAVFFRRNTGPVDALHVEMDGPMAKWSQGRFAKIVLSIETEDDLLAIHALATQRLLPTAVITDAGKTEFKGVPTRTTVAIGPAAAFEIDAITGKDGLITTKLA